MGIFFFIILYMLYPPLLSEMTEAASNGSNDVE